MTDRFRIYLMAALCSLVGTTALGDEWTRATVRDINVADGKILLDHEEIKKWGMPAMRMVFFASEDGQFADLEKGDVIEIIPESEGKQFVIKDFRKPSSGSKAEGETTEQGPTAIDFTAPSLTGDTPVSLSDFRGRVVILNFWASWCAPCLYEMPHFQALYDEYKDRGLTVLAVAVKDEREEAQKFIQTQEFTFPSVFDEGDRVFDAYELVGPPQTYIIDKAGHLTKIPDPRTGKETFVTSNPKIWKTPEIARLIERLLDG